MWKSISALLLVSFLMSPLGFARNDAAIVLMNSAGKERKRIDKISADRVCYVSARWKTSASS